ncbi:hypothetical protein GA0115240_112614 [Streptomyces sp. DvalAA-14]|uniref:putative glycolipid-binding domain-containing protein n=1 Tax=unclassified Streptomyces TaxID=2593676 RepID=UPI00081AFCE9|nr:putative glycolipid-binding domain-containing protein [Streptomyces sp. DvalAA-14]MYS19751.1 hypothetical protein [Streptomyces sp. SID4948]SCD52240.1 hypothetical protein GA0115240_112614 [Streptomyces sp. DvalAA-14]
MTTHHVPSWEVTESGGFETSWIERDGDTLRARGRAVGTIPEAYWISYALETGPDFVTRRLQVTAESSAATRELDLRRHDDGRWTADGEPLSGLHRALDCDLGLCPLTNSMPVLRHGLHRGPGEQDFLMAFVSVPDLTVRPSRQHYAHLSRTTGGARVRYTSGDYSSELEFDPAGLVIDYRGMARRLTSSA